MRKGILFISIFVLLASFNFVFAQDKVKIIFFYGETCPHCAAEKSFLDELTKEYPEIKINSFAVSKNVELLMQLYQDYDVPQEIYGLVPITFIENKYFLGFSQEIGQRIKDCVLEIIEDSTNGEPCDSEEPTEEPPEDVSTPFDWKKPISLPFIGEIDPAKYSLPALAVILGFFDGFNVCSLGALVLILGLVLSLRSRMKILFFGGIFILTTAIIYGFLIVLWYKLFEFLSSYSRAMQILIGLLGLGGGIYFLWQFIKFRKQGPVCETATAGGIVSRFSSKIQEAFKKPGNFLGVVGALLLFAGIITIVEFPCSAFVPVSFAGILAEADLPTFLYGSYVALFVLFYMLDEILVFLIATWKMTIWLASPKFVTWITLIESIFLFLLGAYYLVGFAAL